MPIGDAPKKWWLADEHFPEEGPVVHASQAWWDLFFSLICEGQGMENACRLTSLLQRANITWAALKLAIDAFPDLAERIQLARAWQKMRAREKISSEIPNDVAVAKWYLERRDDDFKPKADLTTDGQPLKTYVNLDPSTIGTGSSPVPGSGSGAGPVEE